MKRRTLTEKGDKAKADQTRYEKGHKAAKDEEIDRHEKTMDSLGEQYSGHIERAKSTQKEVKEQEDTLQLQFDEAIEQLTKHIQTTVSEDASQKQPEQAPAENGSRSSTAATAGQCEHHAGDDQLGTDPEAPQHGPPGRRGHTGADGSIVHQACST